MGKEKLLITGSGGFIFSNFVRKAIYDKLNYNIVSIDKVKKSHALNNVYTNKNHKFYIGDVADEHFINVIFEVEKPDIVLHTAAESFVDSSIDNAKPFIISNVLGTQVIIDACLRWNIKRLIYISTDEVYGHLENENDTAWSEDSRLAPRNPYAASKASGEFLVRAAHTTHGLNYNITRSCNTYGPRQDPEKFIPKIIKSVLSEQKMPVYGQGMQMRDWLYVQDSCAAIIKILLDGKPNETYNISAGQEFANIEVFQEVCNALGKGHDLLQFVKDRPGHDFRYSVDSTKLRALGWQPTVKFRDGVKDTVAWFCNNQWFLKLHS